MLMASCSQETPKASVATQADDEDDDGSGSGGRVEEQGERFVDGVGDAVRPRRK